MKVPCGGFELNDQQFDMNNNVVSLKNGGGDSRIVDMVLTSDVENERYIADKTWQEVSDAIQAGKLVVALFNTTVDKETSTNLLIYSTCVEFENEETGKMAYLVECLPTQSGFQLTLGANSKDEYLYSN